MPTIPLHTQPARADESHHVCAPGGYEWWYFDASDERHDRHVVAVVFDGFAFHPRYLREYVRYRRAPTRVSPPVPRQYPCAYLAFYERGLPRGRTLSMTAEPLDGAASRGELRVCSGRMSATLSFAPRVGHAPLELGLNGSVHRWIAGGPFCDVEGSVRCDGQDLTFTGRGYREHHYGTRPFALDVARWFRGRVLFDDAAYAFQVVRATGAGADEARVVQTTAGRSVEISVARPTSDWSGQARPGVEYPRSVALDDVLLLHNPRVIDASAFHARLVYDAVCPGGRCGEALCDAVHPPRLRMPLLGRMIEKAMDRLAAETA